MNTLLVKPEDVLEKAKEIQNFQESMLQSMQTLSTRLDSMFQAEWLGSASAAYNQKAIELIKQVDAALTRIGEYATKLSKVAETYAEAENKIAKANESLSVGNMFES